MDVRINGQRKRLPAGTTNRRLAEKIQAKMITDIQEGRRLEKPDRKRPRKEMIERYKADYVEAKDYYQKARDISIIGHLTSYFGETATLQDVEDMVAGYEHFRLSKGKKPATIVKELGLRRMFNIARKQWKWKVPNRVSEIELPKVQNQRVRYLSEDEYGRLFEALDSSEDAWLKPCVIIAIDTGLRLSNICDLSWSEVNFF